MILGVGAIETGILRVITFKTLAITYRCLELLVFLLPISKEFFRERLNEKQANLEKQFSKLITDYKEHMIQLKNKLVFMIDDKFRESLSVYEVIAPVPSQCFRSLCQQITRVHEIISELLSEQTIVDLFTEIHDKFKQRLKERLNELNVVNDGGPQHALIFSDMTYYIKQFKNLKGLHLISINFLDVWDS
jgi:vacuolar protein sorting-associated protein 54